MSALSSESTLAEIQAAYDDNASYEEDGSETKARAFITACRLLVRQTPKRTAHGGGAGAELEIDTVRIAEELKAAQRWLAAHAGVTSGGPGVRHLSFDGFRD